MTTLSMTPSSSSTQEFTAGCIVGAIVMGVANLDKTKQTASEVCSVANSFYQKLTFGNVMGATVTSIGVSAASIFVIIPCVKDILRSIKI